MTFGPDLNAMIVNGEADAYLMIPENVDSRRLGFRIPLSHKRVILSSTKVSRMPSTTRFARSGSQTRT